MAAWLIRRLDRDQKEYVLFCELQSTGIGLLMSGLLVGPSFVAVSWPCSLDGRERSAAVWMYAPWSFWGQWDGDVWVRDWSTEEIEQGILPLLHRKLCFSLFYKLEFSPMSRFIFFF